MLINDPNLSEDLTKLLICPLCNALCEIFSSENSETICIACGKTFSITGANTIIIPKEHLIKNYQKLTNDIYTSYIENE